MSDDSKAWSGIVVVAVWCGVALALELWCRAAAWSWQRRNTGVVVVEPDLHPPPASALGRFGFLMCWPLLAVLLVGHRIRYGRWGS